MTFLKELRERRIIQILLSYLGALWVVLEVLDQLISRGILPNLVYQVAFIWVLAGIPAALLIGWNHGEKGKQRAPASEILVIVVLIAVALVGSGMSVSNYRVETQLAESSENALELRRVAVKYFDDETDGELAYLADALTEDLIAELTRVDALDVISRNGSARFREADVPPDSMGRALEAGTVVDGTIARRGDNVRLDLRIVDSRSGAVIQRASLERPASEALALRDWVVEEGSRQLRSWIGEEVRVRSRADDAGSVASWTQVQRAEKRRKDAEAALAAGELDAAFAAFDEADALLAEAQRIDPSWAEPSVQRSGLAYRRARIAQNDPGAAVELIEQGVAHADRALELARTNARALEMRGTLLYYRYLLRVDADERAQAALLEQAREDLRAAVGYDASLAGAYATLSHLYYQVDDIPNAVVSAQRAWEADAYLEVAELVLWRLFGGTLDLMNFAPAVRWCDEGSRRFPESYRFASCRLRLMATPAIPTSDLDVDEAWRLLARQDSLVPERSAAFEHARGLMTLAAVLARASLADSARAVLDRARASVDAEVDPTRELLLVEAYARTVLGEEDRAVRLLVEHEAAVPGAFAAGGASLWWWRDLEDQPEFRRLVGRS